MYQPTVYLILWNDEYIDRVPYLNRNINSNIVTKSINCSLISLYALKTMKVETIPYECWMDDIVVS